MTVSNYPKLVNETPQEIAKVVRQIIRIRQTEDVQRFNNLDNRYLPGRFAGRVPAHSSDILATDQIGDVSFDTSYRYELMKIGSTQYQWNRMALSSAF